MVKLDKKTIELINKDPNDFANNLEIKDLVSILKKLSDAYYNTGESLISDAIFDILKDILEKKDPKNSFLKEVGAPIKGTKEMVVLPFPMGSLTKIKPDQGELQKWIDKYKGPYVLSDKLDGASAQLYKNTTGKIMLYSRGHSKEGDDELNKGQLITHLLDIINIDKKALDNLPIETSIRGELIISKKNFEKIKDIMKNARNAVSGVVNSKTVDKSIASLVQFVTYSVLSPRYKQSEQMNLLQKWGFDFAENKIVDKLSEKELEKYFKIRRETSLFDIDGIVCNDNSKIYKHEAGYPEHAFAFKMVLNDQVALATVVRVIWEPSKYAILKPRIEIKPVNLVGTTITFATAFNAQFVKDNIIGPGAVIEIVRSGDVIPYIQKVVKPAKNNKPDMPDVPYKWNETEVDIILTDIHGDNKDLISAKKLVSFFTTIGVKYMSEGILLKFVKSGYNTITKVLNADKKKLVDINGIGDKMVDKIYDQIDDCMKKVKLHTLMDASGVFGIGLGERKLKEITKKYPNIMTDKFTNDELTDKILKIDGFADILAKKFVENFSDFKKFYEEINKIHDISHLVKVVKEVKQNKKNILDNEKIVFTGFRSDDIKEFIENNGGKVSTSVSGNTTILIHADDADTTSSKFKTAKEKGTTIMSKSEFIKKYMPNN